MAVTTIKTRQIDDNQITYAKLQQASANKLLGNNTGSTANITEITFKDVAEQTYAGTATWNNTAPSGATAHVYKWSQLGKKVDLLIWLIYASGGTNNTLLTLTLPGDVPTPAAPTGLSSASNFQYPTVGFFAQSKTAQTNTNVFKSWLGLAADSSPLISVSSNTNVAALVALVNVTYYTT